MAKADYSLMFVTDDSIRDDETFFEVLESALKGGASIIQLREKQCDTRTFLNRAFTSKELCKSYEVPLLINDRLDIALAVKADGVHIGQQDMPYDMARMLLGPDKIIGLSISNKKQALDANHLDVDYIGLSPIFSTQTKTKDLDAPLGIEGLKNIHSLSVKPIICIGGIHKGNILEIMQNGSAGVAVVSAISKAINPEEETKYLRELLSQTKN